MVFHFFFIYHLPYLPVIFGFLYPVHFFGFQAGPSLPSLLFSSSSISSFSGTSSYQAFCAVRNISSMRWYSFFVNPGLSVVVLDTSSTVALSASSTASSSNTVAHMWYVLVLAPAF